MLCQLTPVEDPNLLVGSSTFDDAAVYRLTGDMAIVQTVDFFTPVVDDPYAFGSITAANALSDIYAMGARPILALNIIAFPCKELPLEILVEILRGGADKVKEAGALMVGGHTIEDREPKYGLAVTGLAHPDQITTNAGAQPGDVLILTKPLGVGIITTAIKGQLADDSAYRAAVDLMASLNDRAARAMSEVGVHACTDVTGFGLLGHLYEMASASGVSARIHLEKVPVLAQARPLAEMGMIPAGAYRNLEHLAQRVQWENEIEELDKLLLADPQTSGGLLIAVSEEKAASLLEAMRKEGVDATGIGEMFESEETMINVFR